MKDIGSIICGCSPCPQGASKLVGRMGHTHESQSKMKEVQRKCNWKSQKEETWSRNGNLCSNSRSACQEKPFSQLLKPYYIRCFLHTSHFVLLQFEFFILFVTNYNFSSLRNATDSNIQEEYFLYPYLLTFLYLSVISSKME